MGSGMYRTPLIGDTNPNEQGVFLGTKTFIEKLGKGGMGEVSNLELGKRRVLFSDGKYIV